MRAQFVAVVLALVAPVTATAQDDEEPPTKSSKKKKAPPPDDADDAPEAAPAKTKTASVSASVSSADLVESGAPKGRMTLPGGGFMLSAIVETNLAKGAAGKPLSVAPDLWIGLADPLTVGIYHSGRAATGFLTSFGTGLCFRGGGDMGICSLGLGDIYTAVGGEVRVGLTEGGLATALVLGGLVRTFEPERVISGKAGFLARVHTKRIAIEISPMAFLGITQRKVAGMDFNRDELAVPVTIFIRFAPRFSFALQSGVTFVLKKPGDTYEIPAAAGLSWWVSPHFSIDAAFGLAAVADKDDMTKPFDQRSATVGLSYAL